MMHRVQKRIMDDNRPTNGKFQATNERGVALIIALAMIVILGLLGAFALSTSTTELHIAGNYRNEQFAYYNADVVQAWGPNNTTVLSNIVPYPINNPKNSYTTAPIPTVAGTTTVTVKFLCTGPPPPGMGADPAIFSALHYLITIIGKGPNGQSEYIVESEMIQLGPKNDPDC